MDFKRVPFRIPLRLEAFWQVSRLGRRAGSLRCRINRIVLVLVRNVHHFSVGLFKALANDSLADNVLRDLDASQDGGNTTTRTFVGILEQLDVANRTVADSVGVNRLKLAVDNLHREGVCLVSLLHRLAYAGFPVRLFTFFLRKHGRHLQAGLLPELFRLGVIGPQLAVPSRLFFVELGIGALRVGAEEEDFGVANDRHMELIVVD